jgi:hypothetical protein
MKIVTTDAELDNCIYFQSIVVVSFGGQEADEGLVQDYTNVTVKINGFYYFRSNSIVKQR